MQTKVDDEDKVGADDVEVQTDKAKKVLGEPKFIEVYIAASFKRQQLFTHVISVTDNRTVFCHLFSNMQVELINT